jgi:V-type H+-transporting ATPase subunit H
MENAVLFEQKDNLELMKKIALECLADEIPDRVKAVACFDIGEFARFYPSGRPILDACEVRPKMM